MLVSLYWWHFLFFSGTLVQLEEFVSFLNTRMPTVKFSLEYDLESIHFLDVEVCKKDQLSTKYL